MVINVRNALRSPGEAFKAEGRMEYQPLEFMGKLAFEGPVLFSGEICSNGEGVVLSGRAQAEDVYKRQDKVYTLFTYAYMRIIKYGGLQPARPALCGARPRRMLINNFPLANIKIVL